MKPIILLLLILGAQIGRAQDSLQTNIPVHDPVMIRQGEVYYGGRSKLRIEVLEWVDGWPVLRLK
jgi:hypothetical protein